MQTLIITIRNSRRKVHLVVVAVVGGGGLLMFLETSDARHVCISLFGQLKIFR